MDSGTPQTSYVPDAARSTVFAQQFFYTLGDIFGGSDSSPRVTGTSQNVDVAVDVTGQAYVRGTTQGLGTSTTTSTAASATAPTIGGLTITPGMVLAGALAMFLFFKRK
jgi:hypothetical protein